MKFAAFVEAFEFEVASFVEFLAIVTALIFVTVVMAVVMIVAVMFFPSASTGACG